MSQRTYQETDPRNMIPRRAGSPPATRLGRDVRPDANGSGGGSPDPPSPEYVERATEPLRKSVPTTDSKANTIAAAKATARPNETAMPWPTPFAGRRNPPAM